MAGGGEEAEQVGRVMSESKATECCVLAFGGPRSAQLWNVSLKFLLSQMPHLQGGCHKLQDVERQGSRRLSLACLLLTDRRKCLPPPNMSHHLLSSPVTAHTTWGGRGVA